MIILNWIELSIHTTNDALEPVTNILNEIGTNGVVIEDPADLSREKRDVFGEVYELDKTKYPNEGLIIKSYFLQNDRWAETLEVIRLRINNLKQYKINLGKNKMTTDIVKEEDWENEWKKYFKPMKVTNRITIVPSWEQYKKTSQDELIITIDPGMAFGTGTHPTTILSLQALEKVIQPNDLVMDVGIGSGILSIAAVLLGAKHVYGYDLDEVAVSSSKQNRDSNHLENEITIKQNDLLKNVDKRVNIIVSNILADILLRLVDDAWNNLEDAGYFITSGIIEAKQQFLIDKLLNTGFEVIETNQYENWVSIIAQKKINSR
ncbi:50S ribosomal protein L11 methyltransferase [Pseudogracilibacillus sp. SO30301A]|uniref:50S ribosomal protein L11 methyltransferase n=1 Tax=Pseudogracilibacillus sp. SO30301A TaxID=3098291 RepID=UPI00300E306D